MHHLDQSGYNIGAAITAVLPTAKMVYTGDDDGRVVRNLPTSVVIVLTFHRSSMNGIAFNDSDGP